MRSCLMSAVEQLSIGGGGVIILDVKVKFSGQIIRVVLQSQGITIWKCSSMVNLRGKVAMDLLGFIV